ncbi:hypothetical protein [Acinetobacter johnsonii]|uniref:hypothetical protein n=1 Tax=Acinetobacter johnsonii TaxID=40214 RepID=UPI001A46FBBB|nr:hypothetical protein [Acinetobacter sp.]
MSEKKKDVPESLVDKPKIKLTLDRVLALTGTAVSEVNTTIGKVFLFPLTFGAVLVYGKIEGDSPKARVRKFLPEIASLSLDRNEEKITIEQAIQLSDEELDSISEAYVLAKQFTSEHENKEKNGEFVRAKSEGYTEYLDRLLQEEVNSTQKMNDRVISPAQGIFDQVRKSSSELGKSWQQYEQLSKVALEPIITSPEYNTRALKIDSELVKHAKIRAKEREQDREIIQLTGRMSAQSAKTLQELADAAATLLERMDQRDKEAKNTTRKQLWLAVGSLFISTIFAGAAVYQDYKNNKDGDRWQSTLLDEIHTLNVQNKNEHQETRLMQEENKKLVSRIVALESELKELQNY